MRYRINYFNKMSDIIDDVKYITVVENVLLKFDKHPLKPVYIPLINIRNGSELKDERKDGKKMNLFLDYLLFFLYKRKVLTK